MAPRKLFQEGRTYYAEYEITCRYKGWVNVCGSDYIPAKCIRRTECYATFELQTSIGTVTRKGRLVSYDGEEGVYLKSRDGLKDFHIRSGQTMD